MDNKWTNLWYSILCGIILLMFLNLLVASGHTTAILMQKYVWSLL